MPEHDGLWKYADTIEQVIGFVYNEATDKDYFGLPGCDLHSGESSKVTKVIWEKLCEEFSGCCPSWVALWEHCDYPCYLTKCRYQCAHCPMVFGRKFPDISLKDLSAGDHMTTLVWSTSVLIGLIKCDSSYMPDTEEIRKAIVTVTDADDYAKRFQAEKEESDMMVAKTQAPNPADEDDE